MHAVPTALRNSYGFATLCIPQKLLHSAGTMIEMLNEGSMKFRTIGHFSNETDKKITIFLEFTCEEIALSPGHEMEFLAKNKEEHFLVHILYHSNAIKILKWYN